MQQVPLVAVTYTLMQQLEKHCTTMRQLSILVNIVMRKAIK